MSKLIFVNHKNEYIYSILTSLAYSAGCLYFSYLLYTGKFFKGPRMSFNTGSDYMINPDMKLSTFAEVRGISEVKTELMELVDMIKNKAKYLNLGARLPKGILLAGEPGTGKTLLARAVAGEANATFFSISGSEFDEMFVGIGPARVRKLFEEARKYSPCVIFIDEIDTIASARFEKGGDRKQETINQLLVEMDGFLENENLVVIAATNTPQDIDPALARPGRFDKTIHVPRPTKADREDIFRFYLSKVISDPAIDVQKIASITTGFTGADIANVVNTALLLAVKNGRHACAECDLMAARDRVLLGIASPNVIRSEEDKMKIAIREASIALSVIQFDKMSKLDKVSIIKRGNHQGQSSKVPVKDNTSINRQQIFNIIKTLLAGSAAEELFYDKMKVSDYNTQKIENACGYLREFYAQGNDEEFGMVFHQNLNRMSKIKKNLLEKALKEQLDQVYKEILEFLRGKENTIKAIASELIKKETLTYEEVISIIEKEKLAYEEVTSTIEKPISNIEKVSENRID